MGKSLGETVRRWDQVGTRRSGLSHKIISIFSSIWFRLEEFRWLGWSFLFLSIICWAKGGELISLVLPTQNISFTLSGNTNYKEIQIISSLQKSEKEQSTTCWIYFTCYRWVITYGRKSADRTKPEFGVIFMGCFRTLFWWLRVVLWQKLKQCLKIYEWQSVYIPLFGPLLHQWPV